MNGIKSGEKPALNVRGLHTYHGGVHVINRVPKKQAIASADALPTRMGLLKGVMISFSCRQNLAKVCWGDGCTPRILQLGAANLAPWYAF
jgi:hypothetical protein